jgi:hypothetical protein
MTRTTTAIFDGHDLKLKDSLGLEPNKWYRVTLDDLPEAAEGSAWSELETLAGSVDAPGDWSSEHDHYLYGAPRRES